MRNSLWNAVSVVLIIGSLALAACGDPDTIRVSGAAAKSRADIVQTSTSGDVEYFLLVGEGCGPLNETIVMVEEDMLPASITCERIERRRFLADYTPGLPTD